MGRFTQQAAVDTTTTDAYLDGVKDGEAWELDGYGGDVALAAKDHGWAEATINAMGSRKCADLWGVDRAAGEDQSDEWRDACAAYEAGVIAALRARADKGDGQQPGPRIVYLTCEGCGLTISQREDDPIEDCMRCGRP